MVIADPPNFNTVLAVETSPGLLAAIHSHFQTGFYLLRLCTLTLNATMTVNGNLTNTIAPGAVTTFNGARMPTRFCHPDKSAWGKRE